MPEIPRFEDADRYAAYLQTAAGRLRTDLAWRGLGEWLPTGPSPRRALDVGGGTGITAARLAEAGFDVVVLDASEGMLALAREAAATRDVAARMTFQHAAADRLTHLYDPDSFDVVVCHNVLEYLSDPPRAVCDIARLLRPGGVCSLLVRNRAGEVLKAALVSRDWTRAAATLSLDSVREGLYGGIVRVFAPSDLLSALGAASLEVVEQRGVRVFADYIEPERLEEADAARVFELESTLGARPEFVAVARYLHVIARRSTGAREPAP